jgi:hypothetical protein
MEDGLKGVGRTRRATSGWYRQRAVRLLMSTLFFGLMPLTVQAQDGSGWPAFQLRLTGFAASTDTFVRADSRSGGLGTGIFMESDTGLDDSRSVAGFDLSWRFLPRHRAQLSYLNLDRDGGRVLGQTLTFRDSVYPAGVQASASFDSRVFAVSYLYSLYQSPQTELALGLGFNQSRMRAGLGLSAGGRQAIETVSEDAPLPTVHFQLGSKFGDSFGADLRGHWLAARADGVRGDLRSLTGGLTWFTWKSLGIELGYAYWKFGLDVNRSSWTGELRYSVKGPTVSLVGVF